jgi:heme exporter protein A
VSVFTGENLSCRRGGRVVFAGLGFALQPGKALLLTGPNGSGKSTLLRVMAGLLGPDSGGLSWDGLAVTEDPASHRRRLHFLGHLDGVKPVLTVRENLRFWARLRTPKRSRAERRLTVEQAIAAYQLETLADIPARLLSAGQRRRVGLARLLTAYAPLWLLDEPTSGLDDTAVSLFERAVDEHREAGGMVVVSSHGGPAPKGAVRVPMAEFKPRPMDWAMGPAGGGAGPGRPARPATA